MNYPELKAALARKETSVSELAEAIEISKQAFYNKISGKSEFKNSEIVAIAEHLGLTGDDVNAIFFDAIVN